MVIAGGLSTLTQRRGSSAVIVMVGIPAWSVLVVCFATWPTATPRLLRQTGGEDTVIIMRGGSASEVSSVLSQEEIVQIQQASGTRPRRQGEPLLTAEGGLP